jgi:hypothetical protein
MAIAHAIGYKNLTEYSFSIKYGAVTMRAFSLWRAMDWMYTLSGFVVGAIVGLTGVGGGSLMTPLLVLLFGIHPATAVGTDLLYAAITKAGGTVVHAARDTSTGASPVCWRAAAFRQRC